MVAPDPSTSVSELIRALGQPVVVCGKYMENTKTIWSINDGVIVIKVILVFL